MTKFTASVGSDLLIMIGLPLIAAVVCNVIFG